MYNYIEIVSRFYQDVQVETIRAGSSTVYDDLIFKVPAEIISQAELETTFDSNISPDERRIILDVAEAEADDIMFWNGNAFVLDNSLRLKVNKYIHVPFVALANAKNKWLSINAAGNESSNIVPFLIPFDTTITVVSIANKIECGTDIEINVNGSIVSTTEVRNVSQSIIDIPNVNVLAGDAVSVYLNGVNGQTTPKFPIVTVWFQTTKSEMT